MFGFTEGGFHPMDAMRERFGNMRAHPFQNLASGLLGAVVPGGGMIGRGMFNKYNQGQFDNAAQTNAGLVGDQMQMDTNDAMNKPLNGMLGQFEDSAGPGGGMGGSIGGPGSGGGYGSNQGWNMSQQWGSPSSFTGGSSFVNDIMSQLPGGPSFTGGQPVTHQDHLMNIENQQNQGGGMPGANYGVSNMMVGGSPVITGYNPDMNQKYLKGR
jgi:hypothetical protein